MYRYIRIMCRYIHLIFHIFKTVCVDTYDSCIDSYHIFFPIFHVFETVWIDTFLVCIDTYMKIFPKFQFQVLRTQQPYTLIFIKQFHPISIKITTETSQDISNIRAQFKTTYSNHYATNSSIHQPKIQHSTLRSKHENRGKSTHPYPHIIYHDPN